MKKTTTPMPAPQFTLCGPSDERLQYQYSEADRHTCGHEVTEGGETLVVVGTGAENAHLENLARELGIDVLELVRFRTSRHRTALSNLPVVDAGPRGAIKSHWKGAPKESLSERHAEDMAFAYMRYLHDCRCSTAGLLTKIISGMVTPRDRKAKKELFAFLSVIDRILLEGVMEHIVARQKEEQNELREVVDRYLASKRAEAAERTKKRARRQRKSPSKSKRAGGLRAA